MSVAVAGGSGLRIVPSRRRVIATRQQEWPVSYRVMR